MELLTDLIEPMPNVQEEDLASLRRAMLLAEREQSRERGRRKLKRIAGREHPYLSSIAEGGLAASYYWSGDYSASIYWARHTIARYAMTKAAVWCSSLLVLVFRNLGMRRERFEAEGERFRIIRQMAFHCTNVPDRVYALQELLKELEARDLPEDAERCAEELEDLISTVRVSRERMVSLLPSE